MENDTIERRTYTRKVANRLLLTTWNIANLGVQERRSQDYQLVWRNDELIRFGRDPGCERSFP